MHCKPSRKSSSDKANIRTIFFGETIEHTYDVGPIKKFSRGVSVIKNN